MSGRLKLVGLVAVVVVAVGIAVIVTTTNHKKITTSGHTDADQKIAAQVADHIMRSGQREHVTWVKVVDGDIFISTDLDGGLPAALQHAKAVAICEVAREVAPNNSDIFVDNYAKLPIWNC